MLKPEDLKSLAQIVDKQRIITDQAEMVVYESDGTPDRGVPDVVVFPKSVDQVVRLAQWANQHHIPIVARGAGTGLSGGAIAEKGGLIIEFAHLNRILEFDIAGRSVVVEPGVVNQELDTRVKAEGLYFPPDPASGRSATIGGNVAENAGGPHCFKYGVMSNYVTGLEVVLVDGRVVRLGGRAFDYPEYDFNALMTGSEGMLGLITKLYSRLLRNPPGVKTMMAAFDSVEQAGQAVSAVIAAGLMPATMEMLDHKVMNIVEGFAHAGLPINAGAMLIIEVDGYPASLDAQMNEIIHIIEQNGAFDLRVAKTAEERERIWYGRKSTAGAFARLAPAKFTVDGTVPRSQLANTLREISEICARLNLDVGYILHAGDGNLHPNMPYFPSNAVQVAHGWQACEEIMRAVVARGGSITGEHGVGIEKREYMAFMCDGAELATMWDVKQVFDSKELLNPGKVFPTKMPAVNRVASLTEPPSDVFTPKTSEETAAGLAALAAAKKKVYINTKRNGAVMLSTSALNQVVKYAPDDLYITVGAGMPLSDVQSFLAKDGWQVPLVSPWKETTVGSIISVNLNSPQRMRYGSVRDVLLCATIALTDGRLVRAGRAVVKNVAGYDLPKAFVGSHGTLGVLTDVTFKLLPLPRSKRTLVIPLRDLKQGLALSPSLLRGALMASAIVITKDVPVPNGSSPYILTYTAEGLIEDVETELAQVCDMVQKANAAQPIEIASPTGTELWCNLQRSATPHSLNVRVGVAPKDLPGYVETNRKALDTSAYLLDCASGLVYAVASPKSVNDAQTWIDSLRHSALASGGYAVATFVPHEWQGKIDPWGYQPETLDLMRDLKRRWDPAGILGIGEFVV